MALSITSAAAHAGCSEHRDIVVDDEGQTRTFRLTLSEVDRILDELGGPQRAKQTLIILWAAYRRSQGRQITGVTIA